MRDESVDCGEGFEHVVAEQENASHGERCDRLHRRLKKLVKARGALDIAEAEALRDAQKLALWRRYGYASLLDYMERELGYSPRAAIERLRVANAIVDLPEIANAMEHGDLCFSAARELTRVATPETEREWMTATAEMNLREIEEKVSGHKRGERPSDPEDPSLRRRVLRLEVSPEMFAYWRQVQYAIEKEKGERVDDTTMVEVLGRTWMAQKAETARDVARYQIAATICATCKKGWQHGGGVTVEMSPASVARAQCDALDVGSIDDVHATKDASTNSECESKAPRAKRTIPLALRRKVELRDHGKCQKPGCRAYRNCDIHHIKPRSEGGKNTLENLITLCESHHLGLHEGAIRIHSEGGRFLFEYEGRNNYTRATRAIETALALKGLGWKPHEIKEAMSRTKTHVGTADLPLQEWIKIALRYCPTALTG